MMHPELAAALFAQDKVRGCKFSGSVESPFLSREAWVSWETGMPAAIIAAPLSSDDHCAMVAKELEQAHFQGVSWEHSSVTKFYVLLRCDDAEIVDIRERLRARRPAQSR